MIGLESCSNLNEVDSCDVGFSMIADLKGAHWAATAQGRFQRYVLDKRHTYRVRIGTLGKIGSGRSV